MLSYFFSNLKVLTDSGHGKSILQTVFSDYIWGREDSEPRFAGLWDKRRCSEGHRVKIQEFSAS